MTEKTLSYYRTLPYERVWEARSGVGERYFLVRLAEAPFVAGDGATREEALAHLRQAFDDFILSRLETGLPIPQPNRPEPRQMESTLSVAWEPVAVEVPDSPAAIEEVSTEVPRTAAPAATYEQSVSLGRLALAH